MDRCSNCIAAIEERGIGHVFQDRIVCASCWAKLDAQSLRPPADPIELHLAPRQRKVLELLAAGALVATDRHNSRWIGDYEVQPQTFYPLVEQRLIRLLDPKRKAGVGGNGYVITDRGRGVLNHATNQARS